MIRTLRWVMAGVALEGCWLFACEAMREPSPVLLAVFGAVGGLVLAVAWHAILQPRTRIAGALWLVGALIVFDQALDLVSPYPARFGLLGDTAVDRIHHFVVQGLMARYPIMSAALPALAPGARVTFVPAVLPREVATDDDVEARAALLRVLARAARADGPDGLRVQFLGSGATPDEIAASVLGTHVDAPDQEPDGSYADWRVELLGMMSAQL